MKYLIGLLIASGVFLASPGTVRADVNNFTIQNFHADYILDNDVVGGSLDAVESIDLTFTDNNHGILRAIPKSYQGYDTKLKVTSVERDNLKEQFSSSTENNNLVLKIGDPNRTITGQHTYTIHYHVQRVVNFKEGQQFYWDVNGTQWGQSFERVSASVSLKNGQISATRPVCFSGLQGSSAQNCSATETNGTIDYETTKALNPGENLTIGADLNGVSFVRPTWKNILFDNVYNIVGIVLGLMVALSAVYLWVRFGKDHSGRGVIVPEYEPPENLSPAEVGLLADYKTDTRDLSATLIDLAVRGYIRLHENTKKVLFFTSRSYSAELLKSDTSGLKDHEITLLIAIFEVMSVGSIAKFSDLKPSKMTRAVSSSKKQLEASLTERYSLIEKKSRSLANWMAVIGIGLAVVAFLLGIGVGWGFGVGLGIAAASYFLFSLIMPRRSVAGVEINEKIKGLKLYMNTAEKDRLEKMQSVQRPYAEPTKTPVLFEKLLPYAVALGVEKSWAKQFDGILTERPGWLDSNSTAAFSGAYLASSVGGIATNFSSSFESSSGVSGGSSGGGGGGGGGGGW